MGFLELLPLVIQGGAVAVLLLWIIALIRGDFRTRQELQRADAEIASLRTQLSEAFTNCEADKDLLRKEVKDWQERAWTRLNEFAKPAVAALKERSR